MDEKSKETKEIFFQPDISVDFIRHGEAEYSTAEKETGEYEGLLTETGRDQIEKTIDKIARNITEDELVVIWTSPKKRARESAKVAERTLREKNIPLLHLRPKGALRDAALTPEYRKGFEPDSFWMDSWVNDAQIPEGSETPEDLKVRNEQIITYLERIAKSIQPQGDKKLHFLIFGHEEGVRDLLEEAFGIGTKQEESPQYGESVHVDIQKSSNLENSKMRIHYEGLEDQMIDFDPRERKLQKH